VNWAGRNGFLGGRRYYDYCPEPTISSSSRTKSGPLDLARDEAERYASKASAGFRSGKYVARGQSQPRGKKGH
jgi:hypothetical protein